MKRFFSVAIVALALTACNNSADPIEEKKDSIDSALKEQVEIVDSIADDRKDLIDTIRNRKIDSLEKIDTSKR